LVAAKAKITQTRISFSVLINGPAAINHNFDVFANTTANERAAAAASASAIK
jgi:hypothetical protein